MALLVKQVFFKNFSAKMMTSSNICRHFEFFFMKQKIILC